MAIARTKNKLEKVAINDALPLKAARRDAIANFKSFGQHQRRYKPDFLNTTKLTCAAKKPNAVSITFA